VDQDDIIQYIARTFDGVEVQRPTDGPGAGDTFFFYNPRRDQDPRRRVAFATIVTKDYGEFDSLSKLDRAGVFRLNIGVSRATLNEVVGHPPTTDTTGYDFAALDQLLPHPTYSGQGYVCVLSPSVQTFEKVKALLAEAYSLAAQRIK
jgi:hypothetical protein